MGLDPHHLPIEVETFVKSTLFSASYLSLHSLKTNKQVISLAFFFIPLLHHVLL